MRLAFDKFCDLDLAQTIALNDGMGESSGCVCDTSLKNSPTRKRETDQYKARHGSAHTVCENVVNKV